MKKLLFLLFTSACFFAVTGCDDNDGKIEVPPPYDNPADAKEWYFKGTVDVEIEDGKTYRDEKEIIMKLVFDDAGEYCNMVLYGANFHPGMPLRIDMVTNWISVTKTASGYKLSGNNIVPLYKGRPVPDYTVTNLSVNVTSTGVSLKMMCGDFPTEYNGKGYKPAEGELDKLGSSFDFTPDAAFEGLFRVDAGDNNLDNENTRIEVQFFDEKTKCTIAVYDVTFSPRMPQPVDIYIPGMKCTAGSDGIKITGTGIKAIYEGEESNFEIKDFEGILSEEDFDFTTVISNSPVTYTGRAVEL